MFDMEAVMRIVAAGADPTTATEQELAEFLLGAERVEATIAVAKARATAVFDARCTYAADGAASAAVWLAYRSELPRKQAQAQVRVARRLTAMPATQAALEAGRIGFPKAEVLASAFRDDVADAFGRDEPMLVDAAQGLTTDELAVYLRYWRMAVLPDGALRDAAALRDACEVYLSETIDGLHPLSGQLDTEWGAVIKTVLDQITDELFRADQQADGTPPRSAANRRAQALYEMALRAATVSADGQPRKVPRPTLLVIERDGVAEINGAPVPVESADRVACDAEHIPVTVDHHGHVLDLGRNRRLFSPAQRRALRTMFPTCDWPGCPRPFDDCHLHHADRDWRHGGHTDLRSGRPECHRHHPLLHEGGHRLEIDETGHSHYYRPDGTEITRPRPNTLPPGLINQLPGQRRPPATPRLGPRHPDPPGGPPAPDHGEDRAHDQRSGPRSGQLPLDRPKRADAPPGRPTAPRPDRPPARPPDHGVRRPSDRPPRRPTDRAPRSGPTGPAPPIAASNRRPDGGASPRGPATPSESASTPPRGTAGRDRRRPGRASARSDRPP